MKKATCCIDFLWIGSSLCQSYQRPKPPSSSLIANAFCWRSGGLPSILASPSRYRSYVYPKIHTVSFEIAIHPVADSTHSHWIAIQVALCRHELAPFSQARSRTMHCWSYLAFVPLQTKPSFPIPPSLSASFQPNSMLLVSPYPHKISSVIRHSNARSLQQFQASSVSRRLPSTPTIYCLGPSRNQLFHNCFVGH